MLSAVAPRKTFISENKGYTVADLLAKIGIVIITKTLDVADDGVMLAVKPVSDKVPDVVLADVANVPCTTCNTLPPPAGAAHLTL